MEKGIQIQNELLQFRHTIPFPCYTATIFEMETKVKFILVIKKEFSCITCKISLKFLPSLPVFQTTPTYFFAVAWKCVSSSLKVQGAIIMAKLALKLEQFHTD